MKEPIKAGDPAMIIDGALGSKSPNVGKQVTVVSLQGKHSKLGRIWKCSGENLHIFDGSISTFADIPAIWLKKADSEPLPGAVIEKTLEVA